MRWLFAAALALAGTAANAADLPVAAPASVVESGFSIIDEARIGAAGLFNENQKNESETVYLNGEILFTKFDVRVFENDFLNSYFTPRFTVGGTLSPTGGTNVGYAGLTWDTTLTQFLAVFELVGIDAKPADTSFTDRIFTTSFFGGAVHDGEVDEQEKGERQFGCRVNFRESAGVGYKLTSKVSVLGYWDHISNAGLCSDNDGLTTLGGKIGFKY